MHLVTILLTLVPEILYQGLVLHILGVVDANQTRIPRQLLVPVELSPTCRDFNNLRYLIFLDLHASLQGKKIWI